MHKNARFTFKKYSDPLWPCDSARARAYTYVPDEIFAPILMKLQARAPEILKYADDLILASQKTGKGREWSWLETMALVHDVWNDLDPEYGAVMAQCIDDAFFRYEDVPYGSGTGFCFTDQVMILREGSINDPVCAAHESGHLMPETIAPDIFDSHPAHNIKEIQAMFVQEHAYARLKAHARDAAEELSVRIHRLSYYTGILANIPFYTWKLDHRQESAEPGQELIAQSLVTEFSRWSVDAKMIPFLTRKKYDDEENEDRKDPQQMHTHPFAAMMVPAFYQIFQGKDEAAKRKILSVMFENGSETTLTDVLSAFDIETPEDVRKAAARTCDNFAGEISQFVAGEKRPYQALFPA